MRIRVGFMLNRHRTKSIWITFRTVENLNIRVSRSIVKSSDIRVKEITLCERDDVSQYG